MSNALAGFSRAALLEELARRERLREERAEIEHWCTDCAHFKFVTGDVPDDHNCCQKAHKMNFRVPESPHGDDGGFYRRVCADREPRSPHSASGERQ